MSMYYDIVSKDKTYVPGDIYYLNGRNFKMDFHRHGEGSLEFNYVTEGRCDYYIGDKVFHLKRKNLIIINGYVPHKLVFPDAEEGEVLGISCSQRHKKKGCLPFSELVEIYPELEDMFKGLNEGFTVNDARRFLPVMEEMYREYRGQRNLAYLHNTCVVVMVNVARQTANYGNAVNDRVLEAKDYINKNYGTIQSIEDIAEELHISRVYLQRIFKQETGMTLWTYFNNLRVERAKELLKETNMTVENVMLCVGFSTRQGFNNLFKEMEGMTPTEYREKCKEKKTQTSH